MIQYKEKFIKSFNIKESPSDFELNLFKKTQKYSRYISWIPWLKMLAVCNSLSMYSTKSTSDIDLFIVTEKNRVWFVRFFITIIFYILWVWRKDESNSAWNFCLSFFACENNLDFSKIAIKNDIYLYFWIHYLKPIINNDLAYEKFIDSNLALWIKKDELPKDNKDYIISVKSYQLKAISYLFGFIDWFWYFLYQNIFKLLSPKTKKVQRPFWVIISREILKFHDKDKREDIRDRILD
ncbi:MAG: hypothetical protein ACD_4C00133G0004 [uncultured bacterium (gcode 4)]|uniref:Polymerase nucleotidyl transferase domain-containing protein n=1 Tax=uncultured bacterium (gcode 4) TaxID=1234023 RepID=K2F6X7_9BACT|nr:MAG: hypothetical protein ACD_4C00133G0004 [uncultured bacterium (gcode 4)]